MGGPKPWIPIQHTSFVGRRVILSDGIFIEQTLRKPV